MGERELGTWLLSVAGILKGFLFNILVALKKITTKKKKPKPKNLPASQNKRDSSPCLCHTPRLRVVWEHLVSLKHSPLERPFSSRSLCLLGRTLDWKNNRVSCQIPLISVAAVVAAAAICFSQMDI